MVHVVHWQQLKLFSCRRLNFGWTASRHDGDDGSDDAVAMAFDAGGVDGDDGSFDDNMWLSFDDEDYDECHGGLGAGFDDGEEKDDNSTTNHQAA